jgi:hypothetical protein
MCSLCTIVCNTQIKGGSRLGFVMLRGLQPRVRGTVRAAHSIRRRPTSARCARGPLPEVLVDTLDVFVA